MSFVTALALLVGLLVAAPVAAHLLRRRRAEEKLFPPARLVPPTPPAARRRSFLEDRALFSVRALAVIALALLGATPLLRCSHLALARRSGASVAIAIVVDDSLSMRAPLGNGKARFERAVDAARELGRGLSQGDAAAVVLAGAPPRVALASTTNLGALSDALDALAPSDRATDLDGALALAREMLAGLPQPDKRVVLLSDLADGNPGAPPLEGSGEVTLWTPVPELAAAGADCAITRAERAGRRARVRVACTGAAAGEGAEGAAAPAGPGAAPAMGRALEIRAGEAVLAKVDLDPGLRAEELGVELPEQAPEIVTAALTGADSIPEDDAAPVVSAGGPLSIAVIEDAAATQVATGGPPPIEQALDALDLEASVRPLPGVPEQAEELTPFAGMIVDDAPGFTPEVRRALAAWVERGGVALLTLGPRAAAAPLGASYEPLVPGVIRWGPSPERGADPASAALFGASAASLDDIAPRGRAALAPEASAAPAEILARWKDGAPLVVRRPLGRGAVLAVTLPLSADESDLVLRPAFLALLERFVGTARARGGARRIDAGETWTFDGYREVKVERVSYAEAGRREPVAVAEVDGRLRATPGIAGLYELTLDGERHARAVSVPEREIDLGARRVADSARGTDLGGQRATIDASPYVALLLLLLVAAELVLRVLSRKQPESAAAG